MERKSATALCCAGVLIIFIGILLFPFDGGYTAKVDQMKANNDTDGLKALLNDTNITQNETDYVTIALIDLMYRNNDSIGIKSLLKDNRTYSVAAYELRNLTDEQKTIDTIYDVISENGSPGVDSYLNSNNELLKAAGTKWKQENTKKTTTKKTKKTTKKKKTTTTHYTTTTRYKTYTYYYWVYV